jgi:phosphoribosylformylglycinamidine cyclo-ligase
MLKFDKCPFSRIMAVSGFTNEQEVRMAGSYVSRGVSPTKEDVQDAIRSLDEGIYPGAFCKIVEDSFGDPAYCNVMHADGAGTKSSLAYIQYMETGDPAVFRGVAQDSIVMNLDDMGCVGVTDNFVVSNTIGRNAHRVDGAVVRELIHGYEDVAHALSSHGIRLHMAGGETADVGDLVQTVIADSTVFARLQRSQVIDCSAISPGDSIVGLASFGQATIATTRVSDPTASQRRDTCFCRSTTPHVIRKPTPTHCHPKTFITATSN